MQNDEQIYKILKTIEGGSANVSIPQEDAPEIIAKGYFAFASRKTYIDDEFDYYGCELTAAGREFIARHETAAKVDQGL